MDEHGERKSARYLDIVCQPMFNAASRFRAVGMVAPLISFHRATSNTILRTAD